MANVYTKVIITFDLQLPILYLVIAELFLVSLFIKRTRELFHNAEEFSLIVPRISNN